MKRRELVCEADGMRIDSFLAAHLEGLSRGHIQDLIRSGLVKVGGLAVKPSRVLRMGEHVAVEFPGPEKSAEAPFESWILHEDDDLLVLNKPAGLLMHPLGVSWLTVPEAALAPPENLAALLLTHRPQLRRRGVPRCGIVHRLDRPTSGVLLVAKSRLAYERLLTAFKEKAIAKVYRAVVRGRPSGKGFRVDAPIGRESNRRRIGVTPFGRSAQTGLKVIASCPRAALVEATPLTGRTHQIRAHLAYLGHPVTGDPEHDAAPAAPQPPRLMLHAYRIELVHPATGRKVGYGAELPADFKRFWVECKTFKKS